MSSFPDLGDIAQAVVAVVLVFNSWQAWKTGHDAKRIISDVSEIKAATNGMTANLLKVTARAAHAEGKVEGIAETKTMEN